MNKDFNDLYVFLTIVQVGNFSRAAKKIGGIAFGIEPCDERAGSPAGTQVAEPHHP